MTVAKIKTSHPIQEGLEKPQKAEICFFYPNSRVPKGW